MNFILFTDAARQLQLLKRQLRGSQKAAYAASTWKQLHLQWKSFMTFCLYFKLTALPASVTTICLYAQFLSRSFKAVESIRGYVSAVVTLHKLLGVEAPDTSHVEFRLVLKGLARIKAHLPRRAHPITPQILLSIAQVLDFTNTTHVVFWALFLVAFFSLARKSNLVAQTVCPSVLNHNITRSDVSVFSNFMVLSFKWSKTIQFGQRRLLIPLMAVPGSVLCPVAAYKHMCKLVPAERDSAAFCLPGSGGLLPVTYDQYQKFLKWVIELIGLSSDQFSSHSFRRGGANWAFDCNVPGELIKVLGDWKSDAYQMYLEFGMKKKISIAKRLVSGLSDRMN